MSIYYRATTSPMPLGKNPGPKKYDFSDQPERDKLEGFLESHRPTTCHSRLSSWFACDSPEKSKSYLEAQLSHEKKSGAPLIFAVEMHSPTKLPMALVDPIRAALQRDDLEAAEFIAKEYWTPTQPWKFWEYISAEIPLVQSQIMTLDEMAGYVATNDYSADHARCKKFLETAKRCGSVDYSTLS